MCSATHHANDDSVVLVSPCLDALLAPWNRLRMGRERSHRSVDAGTRSVAGDGGSARSTERPGSATGGVEHLKLYATGNHRN